MIFKIIGEIAEFVLIVTSIYLVAGVYVRSYQPTWSESLDKHRLKAIFVLVLAVSAVKVTEDALGGESGPIDKIILLSIHSHVSSILNNFFKAATLTGSAKILFPLTVAATIALLYVRRRFEALLVSASVVGGAIVIYAIKTMIGRVRPALWDIDWYWGSSFPSGHTLAVSQHSLLQ